MAKDMEDIQVNQIEDDEIDLLALLFKLRQKWYICIIGLLIGALIGALYNRYRVTPMYQSSALIYMRSASSTLSIGDLSLSSDLNEDYVIMFKTRPIMLDVIHDLNLEITPSQLANTISIGTVNDSRIIKISVTNEDPFLAKEIANCTAKRAIEMVKEVDAQSPYIIEDAIASNIPITTSIYKSTIMFGLGGFVLTCGIIVGYTLVNDAVESEEDLERSIGLPVLASIPEDDIFNYDKRQAKSKKKRKEKK